MSFRARVSGARFWRGILALRDPRVFEGPHNIDAAVAALPATTCGLQAPTPSSATFQASTDVVDCRLFCHPIYTGIGEITVRPIDPSDADRAQAFVARLSGTSRYFRFFHALRSLSPGMLKRFVGTDHQVQMILVGLAVTQGRQSIVAEARYCVSGDGATAEIAVAVADEWQRRGAGTALLNMLERIAAANGIKRFTAEAFAVNEAFRSFARAYGFETCRDTDAAYLRFRKHIAREVSLPGCGDFAAR